jgi:hypothetical protein
MWKSELQMVRELIEACECADNSYKGTMADGSVEHEKIKEQLSKLRSEYESLKRG